MNRTNWRTFGPLSIAGLAIVVGLLTLTAPSAAAPVTSYNSDLGYRIDVPTGWRPSAVLSLRFADTREVIGHDVFTARTPSEEGQAQNTSGRGQLSQAWQSALVVEVWRNPNQLSAAAWASAVDKAGWAKGQRISAVKVGGRDGAVVTGGVRYNVAYFVAAADRMYLLGYRVDLGGTPTGVTPGTLNSLIATFQVP